MSQQQERRNVRRIVVCVPESGFDPTEFAVPWKVIQTQIAAQPSEAGYGVEWTFAGPSAMKKQQQNSDDDATTATGTTAATATTAAATADETVSPPHNNNVFLSCDPVMMTGKGLGLLAGSMMAEQTAKDAYNEMVHWDRTERRRRRGETTSAQKGNEANTEGEDEEERSLHRAVGCIKSNKSYSELKVEDYDALLLPGGHCQEMVPYLEDKDLQAFVRAFHAACGGEGPTTVSTVPVIDLEKKEVAAVATDTATTPSSSPTAPRRKYIAAVCHGVVVCGRAGILTGKHCTSLPKWMEHTAHSLTRLWMGNYYRTYGDRTVESEVREAQAGYPSTTPSVKEELTAANNDDQQNHLQGEDGAKTNHETNDETAQATKKAERMRQCHSLYHDGKMMDFTRDSMTDVSASVTVRDGALITARWPGDCHLFGYELLWALWPELRVEDRVRELRMPKKKKGWFG